MKKVFSENKLMILVLIVLGYMFLLNHKFNKINNGQKNDLGYKKEYNLFLDSLSNSIASKSKLLEKQNELLKQEVADMELDITENSKEIKSIKNAFKKRRDDITIMDSTELLKYFKNEFKSK